MDEGYFVEVHGEEREGANKGENKDGFGHEASNLFVHEVLGDDGVADEGEEDHHGAEAEAGVLAYELVDAGQHFELNFGYYYYRKSKESILMKR